MHNCHLVIISLQTKDDDDQEEETPENDNDGYDDMAQSEGSEEEDKDEDENQENRMTRVCIDDTVTEAPTELRSEIGEEQNLEPRDDETQCRVKCTFQLPNKTRCGFWCAEDAETRLPNGDMHEHLCGTHSTAVRIETARTRFETKQSVVKAVREMVIPERDSCMLMGPYDPFYVQNLGIASDSGGNASIGASPEPTDLGPEYNDWMERAWTPSIDNAKMSFKR